MSRRSTRAVLAVAATIVTLAGCGPTPASSPSPSPTLSSSASIVPKPQVSSDFVNRLDGSTATIPLGSVVMTALTGSDEGMLFNKTDVAYENLINGSKDLILVTYPSDEEFQMAADAGVELDVIPVVKDALVFLANTGNQVGNLTQDQVKDIYTGKTTKWSDVGGSDATIIPYQRQINSGSQTLFLKLAMGDTTPMDAPTEMRPGEMSALVDMIADYDNSVNALGYTMFYYATQMYLKDTVKLLSIDGVEPSAQTISDESFPYLTYYYAVVRKDTPADSDARKVIEWMLGDEAQQLASTTNYVPLDPRNITTPEPTYGYFGSTQQNTTQSSGTGGTEVKDIEWQYCSDTGPIYCGMDENYHITSFSYDGHEAMSAGVMQLIGEHPEIQDLEVTSDFAVVGYVDDQDALTYGIISSDGTPMTLSDFFYDSVNYIAYINQNLFNEATNPAYFQWLHGDLYAGGQAQDPPSGFTGLPNDYSNFRVNQDISGGGLYITFTFPQGNPFFSYADGFDMNANPIVTNLNSVDLGIPSDLSPYGRISATRWVQSPTGQTYPILTATSIPSDSDEVLNGKILAQVTANPQMACFKAQYGAERVSLLGYVDPNECADPYETLSLPTLLGQWAFASWDDDPMTVDDLPSTWRTSIPESLLPEDGVTCPVGDESDCTWVDITSFSSSASVRSVWYYLSETRAVIVDQGSVYYITYY